MSKLKVVHIILNLDDGGAQRIVLNYANDFKNDKDYDFRILSLFNRCSKLYMDEINKFAINIDFLNIKSSKNNFINRLLLLKSINNEVYLYLKKYKPDIIHFHLYGTLMYNIKSIIKYKHSIKFYTLHSSPTRFKGYRLILLRATFKYGKVTPLCVTNEQAVLAKEHYKFRNYEVIHNGIDFSSIKRRSISKNNARKKFKLSSIDFVVCAVGRLNKIKRFDFLLEIFKNVKIKKKTSKLIIAGDGPEKDNLINIARELDIYESVFFLGNISNIIELYNASDVLVVSSESESSSLVLLEAQACNLRCVISSGVPNESIVTNKIKKMSKNATNEEWCNAILDVNYVGTHDFSFDDYEIHAMSDKLKGIYIKYWKEYNNEK